MTSAKYLCTLVAIGCSWMASAQTPLGVSNLHGLWNEDNTVTLTFEAPTQGLDDALHLTDLSEISFITVARGPIHQASKVIGSFSNPAPGEALSFTDSNVTTGEVYNYTVTTYVGEKYDDGVYVTVSNLHYPAPVTEAKAVTEMGKAPVTISFRAPALDTDGQPLKALSRITVKKYDTSWNEITVKTVTKPTPGEMYSVTDATAAEGNTVYYYITPYTSDGSGYASTAYCYVGEDTPDAVNALTAEVSDQGVQLNWQANEVGINYGYVDGASLTYTVKRTSMDGLEKTLAEGISETSFTDDSEILAAEEQYYTYNIYSSNSHGTSSAASTSITAGQPCRVPWSEGFDTPVYTSTTYDHGGWTVDAQWVTNTSAYDINSGKTIYPTEGRGLAYVAFSNKVTERQVRTMTSPHLDVRGLQAAIISLLYYATAGGYDNEIALEASADDGEFVRLGTFDYSQAETDGWLEAIVELTELLPAQTLRIRIVAIKGRNSTLVAIDNFSVDTTTGSVVQIGNDDRQTPAYDLFGHPLQGQSRGLIVKDGRKVYCP